MHIQRDTWFNYVGVVTSLHSIDKKKGSRIPAYVTREESDFSPVDMLQYKIVTCIVELLTMRSITCIYKNNWVGILFHAVCKVLYFGA